MQESQICDTRTKNIKDRDTKSRRNTPVMIGDNKIGVSMPKKYLGDWFSENGKTASL